MELSHSLSQHIINAETYFAIAQEALSLNSAKKIKQPSINSINKHEL